MQRRAASKEATEYPPGCVAPLWGCAPKEQVIGVHFCALKEEMKQRLFAFPQPKRSGSDCVGDRAAVLWSYHAGWFARLLFCLCAVLGDWTSTWGLRVPPGPAWGHFLRNVQRGKAKVGYETHKAMCCILFCNASEGLSRQPQCHQHLRAQVFPSGSMFLNTKEQCKEGFSPSKCHNSCAAPEESTERLFPCFPWVPTAP